MNAKTKREKGVVDLCEECGVFFAFSQSQFEEGKKKINLKEGEKLVDIGFGGFVAKKNIDKYLEGLKKIDAEFKEAMKDPKARKKHILDELHNHEAFYAGSIESTMEALGEDFTREEVEAVFKNNKKHFNY